MIELLKPFLKNKKSRFYFFAVDAKTQIDAAVEIKKNRGVLLTEWVAPAEKQVWFTLYLLPQVGFYCIQSILDHECFIENLSEIFPVCNRLQRAIFELTGVATRHATDTRFWLKHNHDISHETFFQKISGEGVHEIPVGPVHAGIIEPGHFRFSVVGETIIKLEIQLGYTHKGIHELLKNVDIDTAQKLMGRISGDSTVAYAHAFALACEQLDSHELSLTTQYERTILLERERIANHLGDVGAIINDAGLPSVQSFFTLLKENLLQCNFNYFGHRYAMDCISPFLETHFLSQRKLLAMETELNLCKEKLSELKIMVSQHGGLQDRLQNTGVLKKEIAEKLGMVGLASKASGIDLDTRKLYLDETLSSIISTIKITTGDVASRVLVRLQECFDSIQLIQTMIAKLKNTANYFPEKKSLMSLKDGLGIGVTEGWRGPICVMIFIKKDKIVWCHFHDPSWQNWLALEYAVLDNFVPDFPLINKSFNLSYSGHDS